MNKLRGWKDYQERMARVVAHVHQHLGEPLDLERLAEVANLSPFHWHRTYHALFGETIADTVRRLRLHQASGDLAHSSQSVARIAARCGYANTQSFTRAFRTHYGMSPTQYRQQGAHQQFGRASRAQAVQEFPVDVRYVERVFLGGLDHRGSYMKIGAAFEAAWIALSSRGLAPEGSRWMAVYFDDPFAVPQAQLASRAGLSVALGAAVPAPLERFELGGTRCAVLRYRGPYAGMRAAYEWLYGTWLVGSGHVAANLPVFEEYLNSPRETAPADLLTDIYLPLASEAVSA